MNTVEPIRDKRDIEAMEMYLRAKNEKYYIMFITGVNLGLRINEILQLKIGDVKGKKTVRIRQSKTGKEWTGELNSKLIREYKRYCEHKAPGEALIPNRGNEYKSITRDMAYKVLREAGEHCGIDNIGTHSMRKTCGYHFYKKTGKIGILQEWFNHSSESVTKRYIGITSEDVGKAMKKFCI